MAKKDALPMYIKIFYSSSIVIFLIFISVYFLQINTIEIKKYDMHEYDGFVTVMDNVYYLKTAGRFVVVEKGTSELAVLNLETGKLVDKTFIFESSKELVKITPHAIIPLKPNIINFLFKHGLKGIENTETIGLKNPPIIFFILLPLVISIIAHKIVRIKQ